MTEEKKRKQKYADQPDKPTKRQKAKVQFHGNSKKSEAKNVKMFSSAVPTSNLSAARKSGGCAAGSAKSSKSRRKPGKTSKREGESYHSPVEKKLKICNAISNKETVETTKPDKNGSVIKPKVASWKKRSGKERKRKWVLNRKLKRQRKQEHEKNTFVKCDKLQVVDDSTTVQPEESRTFLKVKVPMESKTTMQPGRYVVNVEKSQQKMRREKKRKAVAINSSQPDLPSSKAEMSSNWKQLQTILKKTKIPSRKHEERKKIVRPRNRENTWKETISDDTQSETVHSKIWFDDVDDILIETVKRVEEQKRTNQESSQEHKRTNQESSQEQKQTSQESSQKQKWINPESSLNKSDDRLVKTGSFSGITKVVAIDCEMVGVGEGGKDSVLARVSLVNQYGHCIYDKYVKTLEPVTDYRTHVSGIRPQHLKNGEELYTVQKDVSEIIKGRLLVGHAIENDLKVLFLDHSRKKIRDTSRYKPFRKLFDGRKPALRKLCDKLLSVKVQEGEHNSVQDAQATMRLYTLVRRDWEKDNPRENKKKNIATELGKI